MKRILKMFLLVFFLIVIYIYVLVVSAIPDELVIFQGEKISMNTLFGIKINNNLEAVTTSANNSNEINSSEVR